MLLVEDDRGVDLLDPPPVHAELLLQFSLAEEPEEVHVALAVHQVVDTVQPAEAVGLQVVLRHAVFVGRSRVHEHLRLDVEVPDDPGIHSELAGNRVHERDRDHGPAERGVAAVLPLCVLQDLSSDLLIDQHHVGTREGNLGGDAGRTSGERLGDEIVGDHEGDLVDLLQEPLSEVVPLSGQVFEGLRRELAFVGLQGEGLGRALRQVPTVTQEVDHGLLEIVTARFLAILLSVDREPRGEGELAALPLRQQLGPGVVRANVPERAQGDQQNA